jgi:hypothetical protein
MIRVWIVSKGKRGLKREVVKFYDWDSALEFVYEYNAENAELGSYASVEAE